MEGDNRSARHNENDAKRSDKNKQKLRKPMPEEDSLYQVVGVEPDDKTQRSPKKSPKDAREKALVKPKLAKTTSDSESRASETVYENIGSTTSHSDYSYDNYTSDSSTNKTLEKGQKNKKVSKKNKNGNVISPTNMSTVPRKRLAKMENSGQKGYLGVHTRLDAEHLLGSKHTFALYHDLGFSPILCNINKEIQLSAVYRSSNGNLCHFPIREQNHDDLTKEYYVDTGKSTIPTTFPTIESLIENYCQKEAIN